MARSLSNVVVPGVVFAAVASIFVACSNSNGGGTPAAGGAAGFGAAGAATGGMIASGGMIAAGGMPASGGMSASGGSTPITGGATGAGGSSGASGATGTGGMMSTDAGVLGYVCYNHLKALDPGGTGMADASCCGGLGKCTPKSSAMSRPGASGFTHDTCMKSSTDASDLVCAPLPTGDAGAAAEGLYAKCMAQIGPTAFEGRCLPKCFIQGHPNASTLTPSGCMAGPLNLICAPCYNPVDGTPTGSCSVAPDDKPKTAAPTPYAKCGGRDGGMPLGTCVPKSVALASGNPAAPSLKQDDCSSADYVCTPTLKAQDVNACFPKCQSGLSAAFADGACVPIYVATDVSPSALAFVKQTSCNPGEVCGPCQDVLHVGEPSHACQ